MGRAPTSLPGADLGPWGDYGNEQARISSSSSRAASVGRDVCWSQLNNFPSLIMWLKDRDQPFTSLSYGCNLSNLLTFTFTKMPI